MHTQLRRDTYTPSPRLTRPRARHRDTEPDDDTLWHSSSGKSECIPLEKRCVAQLKRVVDQTGARVVLSSTWRLDNNQSGFVREALGLAGLEGVVLGHTPSHTGPVQPLSRLGLCGAHS